MKRPGATLILLRIVLVLHAGLVLLQPVMAGYYLSGEADAMNWHGPIGSSLWMLSFIQFLVALLYWWPGGGRFWPALTTLALFLAEMIQMILGHNQTLSVHVPLGTAIVISVLLFTTWSFRPVAGQGRQARRVRQEEVAR